MDRQRQIKLLQDLIQIETIDDHEKQVVDYLEKLFAPYGNRVSLTRVPYQGDRESVVISIGPTNGDFTLGFSGHMDVVNLGDRSVWKDDPFSGKLYDNDTKIYGRGTTDMKSGLAGMIGTFLTLLDEKVELTGELRLLATVGEETGMWGSEELTKQGYVDDLDVLVIGEDTTDLNVVYASNGDIDYTVTSYGKVAISSKAGAGINALDNMLDFIDLANDKLRNLPRIHETLGPVVHNVTMISGGDQVNSIPGKITARGNIRINPLYTVAEIQAILEDVVGQINQMPQHKFDLQYDYLGEAVDGDLKGEYVTTAKSMLTDILDKPVKIVGEPGATDASNFVKSKNAPTMIVVGPGNDSVHQIDEYVDVAEYLAAAEFYERFAKKYLS
ncbi:ArgE/DapE family deacylase [Ligilactobacillus pobuzihii]|uniref:Probable succinyl-diaminopimelate desuccinylase n=1 Tax=Ligilactobacillus pobuzihii TaxID=449659 RepID=A0A0R2L8Y7_9LACO|nr:ArgE/DapE family deacylase [Ligilactobacillus pobuzihii]KRK09452.1 acetylornithine deacetylase succinyl-diaminopimelate desuccinylase-like protein [Ligilactobacillus pobuzihii E100301 = KCTC 13174]KRN95578.1 acetylornithine deacetylase succinyl-diaminopimelate desuccinylase-like protein [Ligilactobacillus pobuzihii]GEN48004.1 succinyl-diaminopimelate desuccinylase [Ligilactobacillus pobuzihii]